MDIDKAFDSLDHNYSISILEKYGSGKNFIFYLFLFFRDQESCSINGVITTKYLSLGRRAHQGNPISTFLFILALGILFILMKSKPEIEGMTIFDYNYLYFVHADDTIIFLKDIISIKIWLTLFFPYFSRLKPSLTKSKTGETRVLKGVKVAVCGMHCIDLKIDTLKILGTYFFCNKKLKEEKKIYNTVIDSQRVLKIWKMRKLTLE